MAQCVQLLPWKLNNPSSIPTTPIKIEGVSQLHKFRYVPTQIDNNNEWFLKAISTHSVVMNKDMGFLESYVTFQRVEAHLKNWC